MIYGERIRQARELRGLTQEELAFRIKVSQGLIAQYEGDVYHVPEDTIGAIAFQTGFPPSFFRKPPNETFPSGSLLFRASLTMTRKQIAEAHRYGQTIYEIAEFMERQVNAIPCKLPRMGDNPIEAAQFTRNAMGLAPGIPIPNLIDSIERIGVLVLVVPIALKNRDAYSNWVGSVRPVIVVTKIKSGDRLRFSVAHELGHLVMHQSINGDRKKLENQAHRFASELLMPEVEMRRDIETPVTLTGLSKLKPKWRVSIQALIKRASDLGIVTPRQYFYLYEQLGIKGWRTQEPIEIPPEKPRAMKKMAELLYGIPIHYERLAKETDLTVRFLRDLMEGYADKLDDPTPKTRRVLSLTKRK